jgi:hypothetical protein
MTGATELNGSPLTLSPSLASFLRTGNLRGSPILKTYQRWPHRFARHSPMQPAYTRHHLSNERATLLQVPMGVDKARNMSNYAEDRAK